MGYGQQPDQDYGYMDGYLKKKYQSGNEDLQNQANQLTNTAQMASSSTDTPSSSISDYLKPSPEFTTGASRGSSGGLGSMLMSGGMASGNPYAMGAGLGVMALEGDAQGKQAEEEAKAQEAQKRKQEQLAAINSLISVSKGLSVM